MGRPRLDGLDSTHEEPGCLRFDVYQNIHTPDQLHLYEVSVNKMAFEYHAKTPHIAKWREAVKDVYAGEPTGSRHGPNVWPPDNRGWSSKRFFVVVALSQRAIRRRSPTRSGPSTARESSLNSWAC